MNELELVATLKELEEQRSLLGTRCTQLAAALAVMTKKCEDSENAVKQLQGEIAELRPKELN